MPGCFADFHGFFGDSVYDFRVYGFRVFWGLEFGVKGLGSSCEALRVLAELYELLLLMLAQGLLKVRAEAATLLLPRQASEAFQKSLKTPPRKGARAFSSLSALHLEPKP